MPSRCGLGENSGPQGCIIGKGGPFGMLGSPVSWVKHGVTMSGTAFHLCSVFTYGTGYRVFSLYCFFVLHSPVRPTVLYLTMLIMTVHAV